MNEAKAIQLFKCLADKSRLQILKTLVIEDMYVERISERLNLSPSTVSFHLKKLADVGAVTSYKSQYYTMYSLCKEIFFTNLMEIIIAESDDISLQEERDTEYRQKVIGSFFEYDKLISLPTQGKKRKIVLEEIAKRFEHNREYLEKEVNFIIADVHDDFCTIRKELVVEKLLERNEMYYKKI